MPRYRLYFLDAQGAIQAREDFEAADDSVAIAVFELVCRGCSDVCTACELWQGERVVVQYRPHSDCTIQIDAAPEAALRIALKVEQAIQNGYWAIARSSKLLDDSERLKAKLAHASA